VTLDRGTVIPALPVPDREQSSESSTIPGRTPCRAPIRRVEGACLAGRPRAVETRRANEYRGLVPIDDEQFQSLLEQVRDLHRRTDALMRESSRTHEHIRARLRWDRNPPSLPPNSRKLADEVVDALTKPRLSSGQSRQLYRAFFER
jgi:hypothetical protein